MVSRVNKISCCTRLTRTTATRRHQAQTTHTHAVPERSIATLPYPLAPRNSGTFVSHTPPGRTRAHSMALMLPVSASSMLLDEEMGCGFRFPVATSVMPLWDIELVALMTRTPDTFSCSQWHAAAPEGQRRHSRGGHTRADPSHCPNTHQHDARWVIGSRVRRTPGRYTRLTRFNRISIACTTPRVAIHDRRQVAEAQRSVHTQTSPWQAVPYLTCQGHVCRGRRSAAGCCLCTIVCRLLAHCGKYLHIPICVCASSAFGQSEAFGTLSSGAVIDKITLT